MTEKDKKIETKNLSPTELPSSNKSLDSEKSVIPPKPTKPPKPEDKPFKEFLIEELIPGLKHELIKNGIQPISIESIKGERPVVGGECSMIVAEIAPGRRFWLSFSKDELTSTKTISLAETGAEPYTLESFLIDEKKTTLALLISRILQRLNGQKWLGPN